MKKATVSKDPLAEKIEELCINRSESPMCTEF